MLCMVLQQHVRNSLESHFGEAGTPAKTLVSRLRGTYRGLKSRVNRVLMVTTSAFCA